MALPGTLRRRGVPGTMQASSPTEVCYNAGFPFGRGPSVDRRGGIYCARRRVSEANRRAAAALGPEIPPAGVCAAAGFPGRCKHRPLQRFVITRGSRLAADLPLAVGAGFIPPAGAFRRPTAAQRRLLGRRSRPRTPAPPQTGRIWRPPLRGAHFPGWPPRPRMGHPGHFKTDTATRPRACLAGPGARFCSAFCFNAPGIRPRGRQGCGGLSRGCRSCARRCAAAARRAAKR